MIRMKCVLLAFAFAITRTTYTAPVSDQPLAEKGNEHNITSLSLTPSLPEGQQSRKQAVKEDEGEVKNSQGGREALPSTPARPEEPAENEPTRINSQEQQKIAEGPLPEPKDREPIAAMPAAVTPATDGERPSGDKPTSANIGDNKEATGFPSQEPIKVAEGPTPKPVDTEPIAAMPAAVTPDTNDRRPSGVDNKPTSESTDIDEQKNTPAPPLKKKESIFTIFMRWLSRIFYFL
ncbi:hypothetical protein D918_03083 [Trichuris suis]|nr:hypothetical protein D918_03083 [Trichuris suis]